MPPPGEDTLHTWGRLRDTLLGGCTERGNVSYKLTFFHLRSRYSPEDGSYPMDAPSLDIGARLTQNHLATSGQ